MTTEAEQIKDIDELRSLLQSGHTFGLRTVKSGTFCFERKNKMGDVTTVSATFLPPELDRFELNIITGKGRGGATATFGLKMLRHGEWEEVYRIDYKRQNGWHLDSVPYRLQHEPLPMVSRWRDALALVMQYQESLPFNFGLLNPVFLNPEQPMAQ